MKIGNSRNQYKYTEKVMTYNTENCLCFNLNSCLGLEG